MPDWLIAQLAQMQGGVMRSLATELRSGGFGSLALAYALGALHALTPGHGKAALMAFFLGQEGRFATGLRVAFGASMLHVVSGFVAFLALSFIVGRVPSLSGRSSPWFTIIGYGLISFAGLLMIWQSIRPRREHSHQHPATITAGIGLLPCPLTISVLGFAWLQGTVGMVGLVLMALTLGIATTIAFAAVTAIAFRSLLGSAFTSHAAGMERWGRLLQGVAGVAILAVGLFTLVNALS